MSSVDVCAVCGAAHADLGGQAGCGNPAHGHRLLFHGTQGSRVLYRCPAHKCPVVITTPRNPEPVKGETMSAQPAIHHPLPPQTELAIRPDQTRFDKYQIAALRTKGIENVPNAELAVFFHHCKSRGLDPFAGHATIIGFKERDGSKRWTIITEIDGFRHIGHRAANARGDVIGQPDPVFVDMDGVEHKHWVKPPTEPPRMVKSTIVKNGSPFVGVANYYEFGHFARDSKGQKDYSRPEGMTRDMPANQTAKCAEAQAWRKAYQDVLADLPIEIDVAAGPEPPAWHIAAAVQPQPVPAPAGPGRNRAVAGVLGQWRRLGIGSDDEILNLTAALAGTDTVLDNVADLSTPQLEALTVLLERCEDISQVHALLEGGDAPGDDAAYD
jgi:phage recombination protein Bet